MNLLEHTLYINLEHREDRKWHVIAQLNAIALDKEPDKDSKKETRKKNIERFPAVKSKYGAVGCTLSHIKCLEYAKSLEWEYVCIVEDDFRCINPEKFRKSLDDFETNAEKDGISWDVLLLGGNNCPPYHVPVSNKSGKPIDYCVQITNCQCTIAYVARKTMYDTLIQNYREGVAKLMRDPENKHQFALDMYWKTLQTTGRWYLLVPLTITQMVSYSDVEEKETNYDHLMLDINKPWLFQAQQQQTVLQNMTCFKKQMF